MILPIISTAVFNILSMPDLSTYHFMPYSDFITSGGYGPNQVASKTVAPHAYCTLGNATQNNGLAERFDQRDPCSFLGPNKRTGVYFYQNYNVYQKS